jgi:hypothetical protein
MKYFQFIISILFTVLTLSCANMKGEGNNGGEEQKAQTFGTVAEAANAAKVDMMAAADNVNFGVDKEKLRSATPGNPIMKYNVDWNAVLQSDSAASLENLAKGEPVVTVPLIIGPEVVSIVSLRNDNNQFSIGGLGDKQISTDLDMVSKSTGNGINNVAIYEVPNINATVYMVKDSAASRYYTSYNNNSIREPRNGSELMRMIKADAMEFQNKFGEELKKGKLVK